MTGRSAGKMNGVSFVTEIGGAAFQFYASKETGFTHQQFAFAHLGANELCTVTGIVKRLRKWGPS
jgi:hypothetical protein